MRCYQNDISLLCLITRLDETLYRSPSESISSAVFQTCLRWFEEIPVRPQQQLQIDGKFQSKDMNKVPNLPVNTPIQEEYLAAR